MHLGFDELDGYGLSGELWRKMPIDAIFAGNRSVGIGFFDDFLRKAETSLYDGYFTLVTGTGTVGRIASDWDPTSAATKATSGLGLLQLFGTADDDEAIVAYGNAIDAPFHLGRKDLAMEARFRCTTIEADDIGFFVGLGELGAEATTKCIDASDAIDNTYDLIGFQHLKAEGAAVDGMYQVGGQTKVDGAVNTNLDTLATLVAATFVKVGFRYFAQTGTVHWFVDGVEDTAARLKVSGLDSGTFPDDNFMTPLAVVATPAAADESIVLDWWACAQMV
jgi:hypothetical protein